jgi:hypothetical protein
MTELDTNTDPAKKGSYEFSKLETYGDLKKLIQIITLKQKGKKIVSQGVELTIDQLLGLFPGASNVKTGVDFIRAAISKPDVKKTKTWLDKLDIDDDMSKIVDDTVENGFMKAMAASIKAEPNDKSLEPDFNMNAKMVNYLKQQYGGRHITGIAENMELKEYIKSLIRKQLEEESTTAGVGGYSTPFAFAPNPNKALKNAATKYAMKMGWKLAGGMPKKSKVVDYKELWKGKKSAMNETLIKLIEQELLNEVTYSKFKKEVKHRTKSEQLHKAIREVKRKLQEIDRIVEYTSRMKQELSEDEGGISYWKATQNNIGKISEMVSHLNNKIKNLHQ